MRGNRRMQVVAFRVDAVPRAAYSICLRLKVDDAVALTLPLNEPLF